MLLLEVTSRPCNLRLRQVNAGGLTLSNRLAIGDGTAGLLTFTTGAITTGTSNEDVYFYPGSTYTGYDSLHGVIGYVTKSGNTDFDFPLITGTHPADTAVPGWAVECPHAQAWSGKLVPSPMADM